MVPSGEWDRAKKRTSRCPASPGLDWETFKGTSGSPTRDARLHETGHSRTLDQGSVRCSLVGAATALSRKLSVSPRAGGVLAACRRVLLKSEQRVGMDRQTSNTVTQKVDGWQGAGQRAHDRARRSTSIVDVKGGLTYQQFRGCCLLLVLTWAG